MKITKITHHPCIIPMFLYIFFIALYFSSTVGGMNSLDGSQYSLTQALVDGGTVKIDSFMKWTYLTDYAKYNNHFYSDRDPGVSFLAIPFYVVAKYISPLLKVPYNGLNSNADTDSAIQVLTYLTAAFWGATVVPIIYLICRNFKRSQIASIITAVSAGMGTLLWKYCASFYREPVNIAFLLFAVYLLFIISTVKKKKFRKIIYLIVGLSVGICLFVDYSKPYLLPLPIFYILFSQESDKSNSIHNYLLGLITPLIIMFIYNYLSFQNIISNPHAYQNYLIWMHDYKKLFQTPLIPSILINLFSNAPIPHDLLSFFWKNPNIAYQMGAKYATIWTYKGIFVQTPLLFLSLLGWTQLLKLYFKKAILLVIMGLLILLVNSKLTAFWAGGSYDTRYFLPVTILGMLGLPFFIDNTKKVKIRLFRGYRYLMLIFLLGVSVYNSWYSNLTNFAPHVSGEHRFSLFQLHQPFLSPINLLPNLKMLFINTFPNIDNLPILFIFFFLPPLVVYILYTTFSRLVSQVDSDNLEKYNFSPL